MPDIPHLSVPEGKIPEWLKCIRFPTTKDDALQCAEDLGASEAELEFLESLPAAVFTSELGMEHALSLLKRRDIPEHSPAPDQAEDGWSS